MMSLPKQLLDRFQELVYVQCSLSFSPARLINFESRLRERVLALKLSSYDEYLDLLREDCGEFSHFIEQITTKETYFFRNPEQFTALRNVVVPRIEERLCREAERLMVEEGGPGPWKVPFRVWSAGCATGEEAYTIAMTLLDGLQYPRAWQVEVLASDISKAAVTTASLGFYDSDAIRKIPPDSLARWVRLVSGGGVMDARLLEKIAFRMFNLRFLDLKMSPLCSLMQPDGKPESVCMAGCFDVIFCRNVLIYFDFAAQQQLVDNLYTALRPGGWLFTGDAEVLHIYQHRFQLREIEGAQIYQKPENEPDGERVQ